MTSPQIENGFTRIANEILEAIQMYKFTLNEIKLVMCIWRYTYGFQRKSHAISLTFFTNHTGMTRSRANASLKNLVEKKVLIKTEPENKNASSIYEFNKRYTEWQVEKYASFASIETVTSVQNGTSVQDDTRGSVQNDTTGSVQDDTRGSVQNDTTGSVQDDTRGSVQNDTQERKNKEKEKENNKESLNNNSQNEFAEVMKFYSSNLQKGIMETPFNLELLGQLFDEFGLDVLMAAMEVAAKREAKGIMYVEGILKNWKNSGVKNIDDVEKAQSQFNGGTKKNSKAINWEDV